MDVWLSSNLGINIRLSSDFLMDIGLSGDLFMDVWLSSNLGINIRLSSDFLMDTRLSWDILMDIWLSSWVEVSIGNGGIINSSISSSNRGSSICNWLRSICNWGSSSNVGYWLGSAG